MAVLYPWLENYLSQPIHHYAERVFRPGTSTGSETREAALEKLLQCVEASALRAGYSEENAAAIRGDFAANRVLQTGPHLMLVLNPEAYNTHAFSLLGLRKNGCKSYVSYAVSTVKLEERARKGPAWLHVADQSLSLFGLSRNQLIPYNLLSRFEALSFQKQLLKAGDGQRSDGEVEDLLPGGTFERPSHALKAANQALWPKVFGECFSFLQIDDEDIADLCIEHLLDDGSWMRASLFGNTALAASVLAEIDILASGPWHGLLTRSTDFFWHYEAGKRLPLRLVERNLVNPSTGEKVVRFSAHDIVEQLLGRTLIPNLFLMFLLTAILPGVRAVGGSRHPLYYPLMRYVLCRALRATASDDTLERQLAADRLPCAWGHRVIESGDLSLAEILDEHHGWLAALWADHQPLAEACGPMTSFTSDGRWAELHFQLEERRIGRCDPQWAYS